MELQNRAKTIFLCARNTILSSHGDIMKVDCVVQKGVWTVRCSKRSLFGGPEPRASPNLNFLLQSENFKNTLLLLQVRTTDHGPRLPYLQINFTSYF